MCEISCTLNQLQDKKTFKLHSLLDQPECGTLHIDYLEIVQKTNDVVIEILGEFRPTPS